MKTLTVDVVKYSSYPQIQETSIFSYCHEVIMLNLLNLSDCHLSPHRTFSSLEVLSTFSEFGSRHTFLSTVVWEHEGVAYPLCLVHCM